MSHDTTHPLDLLARKLDQWNSLDDEDRRAVKALPFTRRALKAGEHVVWDGDRPQHTCLLLSGFAYRHKVAGNGGRQIMSIHMRGDIVDLQNSLLGLADHNVQMLSAGELALIPIEAVREIAFRRPAVGMAMWYETLVEGSIFREWILNIGRRNAYVRISHLLCEFAMRLEVAELGRQTEYELPITQEQLADAVALTSVHVNRTLMKLEAEDYISRTKRHIVINDWHKLAILADFQPRYLHIRQTAA
jgi:CRP-like cAMP-binding protein